MAEPLRKFSPEDKVLLAIDDDAAICDSIKAFFEDYGFTVLTAGNGEDGLTVFDSRPVDLVLLDLRMPGIDGLEVLDQLKEKSPLTPVVIASGTGNIASVVEALHLGAWDYILKPIADMSVLYHSVAKCLNESELIKENLQYQERLEAVVEKRTRALQLSEERYRAIFEYTGTPCVILKPDYTVEMANSRFCELAGMDRKEIEGRKNWFEFVSQADTERMETYLDRRKNQKVFFTPEHSEFKMFDHTGSAVDVILSVGIMPGNDGLVASLLDISGKKEAEKRWQILERQLRRSQKMEAIGTLSGGIAHDLNNILSPVMGYAEMIMRDAVPGDLFYKRSRKIQKAAERAADLVSQILMFNRQEETERGVVKIQPVVKEVIKLLQVSIPSTIKVVDRIDPGCGYVEAEQTQIHQVVMNLCTNAYHAMEETGGSLTVSLTEETFAADALADYPDLMEGNYLRLEISDTGTGMDEEILSRVFDPYFTTKEEGKGTGLGLSTVFSIVKAHNGGIRVKSSAGEGTTATVLIPVVSGKTAGEWKRTAAPAAEDMTGRRVLFVDDDRDIVEMCKEGLENLGYEVTAFFSSPEALAFFKSRCREIDVVVCDQTMPHMTGLELARAMTGMQKDIPIILCSGYTGAINTDDAKTDEIRAFIMKPFSVDRLSKRIQQVLNHGESRP